jgi:hypothetical protein
MGENWQRRDELLKLRQRAGSIPDVLEAWRAMGVAAPALSFDQHDDLTALARSAEDQRGLNAHSQSTIASRSLRAIFEADC